MAGAGIAAEDSPVSAVAIFLPLLAAALPAITAVALLALHSWRKNFGYSWLIAAAGSLSAFGIALAGGMSLPHSFLLADWQPRPLLPDSPALTIDLISWSFLTAILALNLVTVLTDVYRSATGERPGSHWLALSAGLLLSATAGFSVLSGNMLTLMLSWSAVDLVSLLIWLAYAPSKSEGQAAVLAFGLRLAGSGVIVWCHLQSTTAGTPTALTALVPGAAILSLAAAGLRLGLFPPHRPLPTLSTLTPALHTLTWLAGLAPAWMLMVRAGVAGLSGQTLFLLLGAAGLVYACLAWVSTPSAGEGLPYWSMAVSALALGCAARGESLAALAWGITGLLGGGLICLTSARPRALTPILILGAIGLSALPFSPTWPGASLYRSPYNALQLFYLLGQGLLLVGFVRLAMRRTPLPAAAERWVWLIYPLGLALLPITQFFLAWQGRPGRPGGMQGWPGWIESGLVVIGLGLSVSSGALILRRPRQIYFKRFRPIFELDWLYRAGGGLLRLTGRVVNFLSFALEGRAGLLWALLALALLLSLLAQMGLGS